MTVSISDFTGILSLGINVGNGAPSVTRTADAAWLGSMIDVYEREFLRLLLGEEYAQGFIAWLLVDESQREENAQYEFIEFLLLNGTNGINPAAAYVYFKVLDTANQRASATGVHRTADDGSLNPRALQIRAWNIMAAEVRDIVRIIARDDEGTFEGASIDVSRALCESLNWFGI